MGIKKTLGGDRLGSGNRMKQEMHDFYRSNKNLSTRFASTMAAGVLYPCYVNVGLKGDTFDIDMNAFVRTVPTIGPLYGSFKLQVDVFQIPFRLYQAILHNNTTDIARKMNQVYLPKVELPAKVNPYIEPLNGFNEQIHYSALMRYLYQSGVVACEAGGINEDREFTVKRKINAIPMLAYYDIFKNYYANKQEENAYVIEAGQKELEQKITSVSAGTANETLVLDNETQEGQEYLFTGLLPAKITQVSIQGENLDWESIRIKLTQEVNGAPAGLVYESNLKDLYNLVGISSSLINNAETISFRFTTTRSYQYIDVSADWYAKKPQIELTPFPLENIDNMRKYLLTQWDLGTEVVISESNQNYLPYNIQTKIYETGKPAITYPMAGLCVKTYQSDMFNNWLDTEWVNEITETSAIDVSNGSFTLDMLNFKKKLYDHLNRLAISGGTYDDWQEATYGDKVWGKSEKPIYCGGMSSEIEFDEVVSTAQINSQETFMEQNTKLGSIAGRGGLQGRNGGKITIKVGEASVIMAIASITPRLMYSQGNAWFNTELITMDDLHKPIFDRIGFQDLMVEQMAWWDAKRVFGADNEQGILVPDILERTSAGKQPAWLQYATDVDRVYGEFANNKPGGLNYMVLTRNYEQDEEGNVADVTTYIDPQKFNYAFAYQELDAQNFWTFIGMKIHARRKMSNTQIPNV